MEIIAKTSTKEYLSMRFKTLYNNYAKPFTVYAVTYTIPKSFYNSIVNATPLYTHKLFIAKYIEKVGGTTMIVIEHHRSGYPHSHGLLASTKTLEELKDAYPIENVHAIKLKPITNIDGWIEYCNKRGKGLLSPRDTISLRY